MRLSAAALSTPPSSSPAPLRGRRLWKPAACAAQGAIALTLLAATPAAYAEDGLAHVPAERQAAAAPAPVPAGAVAHLPAEQQVRGSSAQAPTAVDVVQTVRTPIPFPTVRREDRTRYRGVEKVVQAGRTGVLERTYAVVSAAGTEVSRTMLSEERTREPRTRIVAVGTKPVPRPKTTKTVDDGLNWPALARCESGGNPRAVNASGKYRGLYQFDRSTWRSVGGTGDPIDHTADEQTFRAQKLYQARGRSPWPHCGRHL